MEPISIERFIDRVEHLATLPVILRKILEITGDPTHSPQELYEVIAQDQALAERVVRIANSPFFGHSGQVGDIHQAIMLLGYEHIRNISVSMSVLATFSKRGDRNLKQFWLHSFEVAFLAAHIADVAALLSPRAAFLAGLLHDMGRLVFYSIRSDHYRQILGTDDLLDREQVFFGCDHAAAGGLLAEKTRLPEEHVIAIRYHHKPSFAGSYRDLVAVVALAEGLSRRFSPKIEDDGIWTPEHDALLLELSLSNDDLDEMGELLTRKDAELQSFLEMM